MKNASAGVGRYECIVQAHNRHGWSEPSTIHTYHHNPGAFTSYYSFFYVDSRCILCK